MTLLGGLFSRKHKSPRSAADDHAASERSTAASDLDSALSSPTSSYATPSRPIPSYPNGSNLHPDSARHNYPQNAPPTMSSPTMSTSTHASSSSGRLRLFGRKKSAVAETLPSTSPDPMRRSFQITSRPEQGRTSTEVEDSDLRRLRPPPSRSAIFAAYGDPNSALSTRSLPAENTGSPNSLSPSPPVPPKKSSIFAWAKHNANSTPNSPSMVTRVENAPLTTLQDPLGSPSSLDGGSSFNLRSFRHIGPPSPTGSNVSLTPPIPRPRPRGESVNSDASQRISVAAFREAQARRSQAGSPSPSFRSESPAPHVRGKSPDALRGTNAPRPSRSTSHIPAPQLQQRRRSSMAINTTSDSDPAASSSEEDSEDDDVRLGRRVPPSFNRAGNTGKTKAKSEIGHGHAFKTTSRTSDFPAVSPRVPNSHVGHSFSPAPSSSQQSVNRVEENHKTGDVPPRSPSSLAGYGTRPRQRASVSASALSPSMAAKRASIVAASNAKLANDAKTLALSQNGLRTPQPSSRPSQASLNTQTKINVPRPTDSSSDSEDDAPLATLVAPRRPGSAMSSYSNPASRSTGNVTTRSATNMPKPLIDINELTGPKRSYTSPLEKSTAGFTEGPTLLAQTQRKASPPVHQHSPLVESPVSMHQQLPWQVNGGMGQDKELLTSTVPPIKFTSPMTTPSMEKKEFISNRELDAHITLNGDANQESASVRRDSSPEMRRDPITDRLSRAVKNTLQTPSPSNSAASAPTSTVVSPRAASPTPRAMSPNSGSASETSSRRTNGRTTSTHITSPAPQSHPSQSEMPFPRSKKSLDASPPDEELAQLLGTAVQFLSGTEDSPTPAPAAKPKPRNNETSSESSSSDSDTEEDDDTTTAPKTRKSDSDKAASKDRIAPIPIKERSPPPSFSVTSRPPVTRHTNSHSSSSQSALGVATTGSPSGHAPRPRSTTLQTTPSSNAFGTRKTSGGESIAAPHHASKQSTSSLNGNAALATAAASASTTASSSSSSSLGAQARPNGSSNTLKPPAVRQRSSTMITGVPLSAQMNGRTHQPPDQPFAMRRNSPASSTGDSSSGRAPLTPRDGSEIGARPDGGASGTDGPRRHIKRRSVSFEDDMDDLRPPNRSYLKGPSSSHGSSDAGDMSNEEGQEARRKERRRGEAKASIELGNVVNGRGPILDDDDMPINQGMNQRMSMLNPMMAMGNPMAAMQMGQMGFPGSPNTAAWVNPMGQSMLSPAQFMVPPPADPNFLVAHQQAMAIAKQAYQMAVAQQAMAAAADEWERGSTFGGGSVYGGGGGSVYGGGGGGSVYGGSQMGTPYNMMGNMPMMQGGGWYGGSGARSMYGGSQLSVPAMMSSSRSEYAGGGGGGGGNWSSSRSSYGESFGPDQQTRRNGQMGRRGNRDSGFYPPMPTIASHPASGRNSPEQRAPARSAKDSPHRGARKAPPPSSWKAS